MKPTKTQALTAKGARSRARVLEAAFKLFARNGFDAVTVRQIGEAAGLDNSSIYRHFSSKAELANHCLDAAGEGVLSCLGPLPPANPPALADLLDAADALVDHFADKPEAARFLLAVLVEPAGTRSALSISVPPDADRPTNRVLETLGNWLIQARKAGVIREVDVIETLFNIIALVLFRPAVVGSISADFDPEPFSETQRARRRKEVRRFLTLGLDPKLEEPE